MLGKKAPNAKVIEIRDQKLYCCPSTGATSTIMYQLPIKTKDGIRYKGSFISLVMAQDFAKNFWRKNCGKLKCYPPDEKGAASIYADLRSFFEKNFKLTVPEYKGPVPTAQNLHTIMAEVCPPRFAEQVENCKYPGIIRGFPTKSTPTSLKPTSVGIRSVYLDEEKKVDDVCTGGFGDCVVIAKPLTWPEVKKSYPEVYIKYRDTSKKIYYKKEPGEWTPELFVLGKNKHINIFEGKSAKKKKKTGTTPSKSPKTATPAKSPKKASAPKAPEPPSSDEEEDDEDAQDSDES